MMCYDENDLTDGDQVGRPGNCDTVAATSGGWDEIYIYNGTQSAVLVSVPPG